MGGVEIFRLASLLALGPCLLWRLFNTLLAALGHSS
ncbi:hypothetical protein HNP55_004234 [Paucibacter oligotrophus]|uniref:Uncharacterized protein n=1 Tax=Roseateles oligotrophus TaxID=1769250 RepID=A0A840LGD2_9BURK|nr:hypothetical protein [Roseateles oligotrophus]